MKEETAVVEEEKKIKIQGPKEAKA